MFPYRSSIALPNLIECINAIVTFKFFKFLSLWRKLFCYKIYGSYIYYRLCQHYTMSLNRNLMIYSKIVEPDRSYQVSS